LDGKASKHKQILAVKNDILHHINHISLKKSFNPILLLRNLSRDK